MLNEKIYREFENLERKIHLVLAENERIKNELNFTKQENNRLEEEMKIQEVTLKNFQKKLKINKLANNTVVSAENSEQLKGTIDGYIKEIDKCITHLAETNN